MDERCVCVGKGIMAGCKSAFEKGTTRDRRLDVRGRVQGGVKGLM